MKLLTGRPHRLLEETIRRMGARMQKGEACMMIVPSQFTLQAEIEVMTQLRVNGTFLIDVLSPTRLRSRIFERAGEPKRTIIDERGKSMVLTEIVEDLREEFGFYRHVSRSSVEGFAAKVSEWIAAMKRSGATPDSLEKQMTALEQTSAAAQKLSDLLMIFRHYEARMWNQLADEEDVSMEMRAKAAASGVLRGKHVYVYGFDMITETFARDLLAIEEAANDVTLVVETDENSAADGRLFAPVNFSLDRLEEIGRNLGRNIERERIKKPLDVPEDLQYMEQNLFALNPTPFAAEVRHVELHTASTQRAEVHRAAAAIRERIFAGKSASDMAIVYPQNSGYAQIVEGVLPMYGVQAYIAERRAAASHPVCRFVLSALEIAANGFSIAEMTECIRSGFLGLTVEEADALIGYAEETGVRPGGWTKPFIYTAGYREQELESINCAREKATMPLTAFAEAIHRAQTADAAVSAVVSLLERVEAFDMLEQMREELIETGMHSEAQDCAQVWNALMETLDQLHTLLGERKASSQIVLNLLKSGFSALELAALPPADGAVICGEIGNVRTSAVDTLFVLGMNDMGAQGEEGLFSPAEKELVERETGAYLGMSAAERTAMAQLDMLKTFAGARQRLVLSCALADETGRALRMGTAMLSMKRIFPEIDVRGGLAQEELRERLNAPEAALEALALHLSRAADGKNALEPTYEKAYSALNETRRDALAQMTRNLGQAAARTMPPSEARTLYGRPTMSVSRLEMFAQCPYRHFVRYGLTPKEEREPGVNPAELGTLYHEAAERFTRAVTELPTFPQVDAATCDALMDEAVTPLIDGWRASPLGESARGASIAKRIKRTARRAGKSIVSQFAEGQFRPMRFEMTFGQGGAAPIPLELADGSFAYLQGRIDRIDVLEGEERHIRVIDYKSGAKRFDPTMAYWGIQLQLLIYLSAALAKIPGVLPGGFFYCRIADPTVKSESRIQHEVEKQIAKKLALAGVSLSDVQILRAQDLHHAGMIKKDGSVSGTYRASMVDRQGMEGLAAFAQEKVKQLAERAFGGEIDDAPATLGAYNACATCDYAAVCGFDPARKPRRRLAKKSLDDLTGSS